MKCFCVWLASGDFFLVDEQDLRITKGKRYFFYETEGGLPPSVLTGIKHGRLQFSVSLLPQIEEVIQSEEEKKTTEKKNEGETERLFTLILDRLEQIEKKINQIPPKGKKK